MLNEPQHLMRHLVLGGALTAFAVQTAAQKCIPLSGSTACAAFPAASISTSSALVGLYPFLSSVTDTASFDRELSQYVSKGYVQEHYETLFGCTNINLSNTTDYYARYTTSFICNGIIQNSREPCSLSGNALTPLCADSCSGLAVSEEEIVTSNQLCPGRSSSYENQLRSDFTNCALPANSISGNCIEGATNEPDNCGFGDNVMSLCSFCAASTQNNTDSCCVTSNASGRCQNVHLPVFATVSNTFSLTSTQTSTPTSSTSATSSHTGAAASSKTHHGLSGGAIAGIVVGSVLGFLLLLALLIFCCLAIRRRRRHSQTGSILNQPSPKRGGTTPVMSYNPPVSQNGHGYEVLPGGRVARMSALQSEDRGYTANTDPYGGNTPSSDEKYTRVVGAAGAAAAIKPRHSPSSAEDTSPSNGDFSSPEGVASGQSEQLPFFKDYYSNDDIHPGDKVSVLWAYQPRAGDEFELERGDILKVVGIWDDGWATGIRLNDRAEDYDGKHKMQRDSGVSNGSGPRLESLTPAGEIKAFPLVCVCLPEAWRKTVEGDSSTESGGSILPPQH